MPDHLSLFPDKLTGNVLSTSRLERRLPAVVAVAVLWAAFPASPAHGQEAEQSIIPYSARYAVYRNGKLSARAEVLVEQQESSWIIKSETIGTHGMARFMKFRDYEFVEGLQEASRFKPLNYTHELKWLGPDQNTQVEFAWDEMEARVSDDGKEVVFPLVEGAVDPMSLQLELRHELASAAPDLNFMLVEDDAIEEQRFRALPGERMETSLGCLDTIPVEKIRAPSSKRYTRSWHASALSFVPVRLEHGKRDGDRMEMRITELELSGRTVEPFAACAAGQSSRSEP